MTHAGARATRSGSTHALTPRQFVDDLKVLEMGGIGSRALPNGLGETDVPPRPAQEICDQKYFTRDAPPPQRAAATPSPQPGSGRLTRPSPVPSFGGSSASVNTNYSNSGTIGEEKKKKRGFLRF